MDSRIFRILATFRKPLLEETECTAAWCSVDNWQPLTCGVYFNGELKGSNDKR